MSLLETIIADLTTAMKAKDATRLSVLRMVKANLMNRKIEKGGDLTDEEITKAAPVARQTASRLNRTVRRRWPQRSGRKRGGRDRCNRGLSAALRDARRNRRRCGCGGRINRRLVDEGHGRGNESGVGQPRREDRRRKTGQRNGKIEALLTECPPITKINQSAGSTGS